MRPVALEGATPEEIMRLTGTSETSIEIAKRLAQIGLPNKKSEEYRYFPIESLLKRQWEIFRPSFKAFERSDDRILVVDGVVTEVPEGIEVVEGEREWDGTHFDPLYHLSHLLGGLTLTFRFKKDMKIRLEHRFSHPNALIAYRLPFFLAPNVKVEIVETFQSDGGAGAFVLGGYDVEVARDARLRIVQQQTLGACDYTPILSHAIEVQKSGSIDLHTFDFGEGEGLQLIHIELQEMARLDAFHLLYATAEAKRGTVTKIVHQGRSSKSLQKAKSILDNSARGIFDALIRVESTGKYTKAHQNSKAVLLHEGAYMAAKPQLEIYIDDLEASHGATTGELDEDQLFYLRSRGIEVDEARKMLILGFANEMIDILEDEVLQEKIHVAFEEAYYGHAQIDCIQSCHGCEKELLQGKNDGNS